MTFKTACLLSLLFGTTAALSPKSATSPVATADAQFPKESRRIYNQLMNNVKDAAKSGDLSYDTADDILKNAAKLSKFLGKEQLDQVSRSVFSQLTNSKGSSASLVESFFLVAQSSGPANFTLLAKQARDRLEKIQSKRPSFWSRLGDFFGGGTSNKRQVITPETRAKFAGMFDITPAKLRPVQEALSSLAQIATEGGNAISDTTKNFKINSSSEPVEKTAEITKGVGDVVNAVATIIPATNKTSAVKEIAKDVASVATGVSEALRNKNASAIRKTVGVVDAVGNAVGDVVGLFSNIFSRKNNSDRRGTATEKPKSFNFWDIFG